MTHATRQIPVSVIMANFNHGHFLDEALGGLLAQSALPAEIIIIDDASTDDSLEKLRGWSARHPEIIRVLRNETNQGVLRTIQRGLDESRGTYVFFHSADDFILPSCLERYHEMLEAHPDAPLCCSMPGYFTADRNDFSYMDPDWGRRPRRIGADELAGLLRGRWIHGYALVRKSSLLAAGGIDLALDYCADWFWLLLMGARAGLCYIPETLALNRQLPSSFLETGRRDRARTDRMFTRLLERVFSPELSDLHVFLGRSAALAAQGPELAEFILAHGEWQRADLLALTHRNFHLLNGRYDQFEAQNPLTPALGPEASTRRRVNSRLNAVLPRIVEDVRAHNRTRLALYGAGRHSDCLMPIWRDLGGPPFLFTMVSACSGTEFFHGCPVTPIGKVAPGSIDAVVISSQASEAEMARIAKERFPHAVVYTLWST